MRRSDREITDRAVMDEILRRHRVLYLALQDENAPYVIPMTYGYDGECLYLHCAPEGRKLDLMRRHPQVAFAIEAEHEVKPGDVACAWGLNYASVAGVGTAEIVETPEEKQRGLDVLMSHFSDEPQTYKAGTLEQTTVIRVRITSLTGKRND
jgi:nitroimidazol reductase NimA-like FMN-containing flavoprotein (pyridoxamine 5'-phosphate oxidase superfamily)